MNISTRQSFPTILGRLLFVAGIVTTSHATTANAQDTHSSKGPSMSIPAPAKVPPVIIGHTQYGDSSGYNNNVLRIIDTQSGKEINRVDIYHYPLDPRLETDVQTSFFKSMSLTGDGKDILIENTRGNQFLFNIKDQKSRELTHVCALRLTEAQRIGSKWKVLVTISTTNILPAEDLYLDRTSFGDTPRLRNNLFEVKSTTGKIEYRGMMAKRAPPDGVQNLDIAHNPGRSSRKQKVPDEFILLEPGQSREVTIDLGEDYAFPAEGGKFSIKYRHHNHFSPNNVDLVSNTISVELNPDVPTLIQKKPPAPPQ